MHHYMLWRVLCNREVLFEYIHLLKLQMVIKKMMAMAIVKEIQTAQTVMLMLMIMIMVIKIVVKEASQTAQATQTEMVMKT